MNSILKRPHDFTVWEKFLSFDNSIKFLSKYVSLNQANSMGEVDTLLNIKQLCEEIRRELHILEVEYGYNFKQYSP